MPLWSLQDCQLTFLFPTNHLLYRTLPTIEIMWAICRLYFYASAYETNTSQPWHDTRLCIILPFRKCGLLPVLRCITMAGTTAPLSHSTSRVFQCPIYRRPRSPLYILILRIIMTQYGPLSEIIGKPSGVVIFSTRLRDNMNERENWHRWKRGNGGFILP
jgi:hypothetical protein